MWVHMHQSIYIKVEIGAQLKGIFGAFKEITYGSWHTDYFYVYLFIHRATTVFLL